MFLLFFRLIHAVFLISIIGLILPRLVTALHALPRIYSLSEAPSARVAIVFGAGLLRDGTPTRVLRDRVATAVDLYFSGKVEKLLLSGDNSSQYYNEPEAMRRYALGLGIPDDAIVLDYAGRRTYDTCYRAKEIFGVQQAILVTQKFHLPRALYTCSAFGIQVNGVIADRRAYQSYALTYWHLRELAATAAALLDVYFLKPTPILGNPEPIFPVEAQ
jgi:SanA protein